MKSNINSPSIIVCAHNNFQYTDRFLTYVTKHWKSPKIYFAWSGKRKIKTEDINKKFLLKSNIKILNYSETTEYHKKILLALKAVSEKYIFLVGIDDFPLHSFARKAIKELKESKNYFCSGIKLKINDKKKVQVHFATIPSQSNAFHRIIYSQLRILFGPASVIGNWHFYGVHYKQALIESLSTLPKKEKYSSSLEELLLAKIFVKKPVTFLDSICSIHDDTNIKNKNLSDGGYSYWHIKKNYSKYFKTELKNHLSEEEVEQFLKFRLGDIDYKLPKEFYLRKKIYKFFLVSPFEVKQNIKINLKKKIYLSLLNLIYVIFILRYFRLSLILNKRLIIQNLIDFLILKDFNLSHVKLNNHINNKQEIYDTLKGFTS